MELREVKRNMHHIITFHNAPYRLTGIIFRGRNNDGVEVYQAELQDVRNGNSVVICSLDQIEERESELCANGSA